MNQKECLFTFYIVTIIYLLIAPHFAFGPGYLTSSSFWMIYIPICLMVLVPGVVAIYNQTTF